MPPPATTPEGSTLDRAAEVFHRVRLLGLAQRDEAIAAACQNDASLEATVRLLLKGDNAALPVERLADDIRAVHEVLNLEGATAGHSSALFKADGTHIGPYRLLERIGEGGFGIVFMAAQEHPVRRRVALKVVKLGMDTKQVVARFEAERQALALMDHPCIARVFDGGATPTGRPYFVMELVRGVPITEYCDSHKLGLRGRLGLVSQVCNALQHAHQRGVIHRDIKPSNVLVVAENGAPTPKIIDFGIAKATTGRLTDRTLFTELRQMIGTPAYMSPEQAGQTSEDVDTRTDVYAVGVLLYELLTGATPFDSKRLASAAYGEIQRIIREEDPPKPSTRVASKPGTLIGVAEKRATAPTKLSTTIQGELDWIVMKAMEKDRTRRYDSAGAFAADIERYLTGHAVSAAPPGRAYLVRKFVRRNRGAVIAGGLLTLAVLAGLAGTSVGLVRTERERKVAVRERERADLNAGQAREAESLATRQAYSASMLSASAAINNVQFAAAGSFLEAAPQSLRGWEWRLLHARLDTSIRAFPTTSASSGLPLLPQFYGLHVHPDGQSLFTTDRHADPAAQRWSVKTGELLQSFARLSLPTTQPPLMVETLLSADGSRLWLHAIPQSQRVDFVLETWDVASGARVDRATFAPPHFPGLEVRVSPDATRVLFQPLDAATWTLTDTAGRVQATSTASQMAIHETMPFSHDGKRVVGFDRDYRTMTISDAQSLAPLSTVPLGSAMVMKTAFSQDERWLALAVDGGFAQVFDTAASPPTSVRMPHPARVGNVAFSPDASVLATVAEDRAIRVWDRASGELLATYPSPSLINAPLAILPDGKTVVGQETDGHVRFWDLTAEQTRVLRGHTSIVSNAMFVPNNPAGLIISGGWDGQSGSARSLRLWDEDSGELVTTLDGPSTGMIQLQHLACSRDGTRAVAAWGSPLVEHRQVALLDLQTGQRLWTRQAPQDGPVLFVAIAPDTSAVYIAERASFGTVDGQGYQLNLLDPASGEIVATRVMEAKPRWSFALTPQGDALLAMPFSREPGEESQEPTTMLVLDPRTLQTVRMIKNITEPVHTITFAPDGRRFATCNWDGSVRLYDFNSGSRLATLSGHVDVVMAAAFSPDGRRLATAGKDRLIRIWSLETFDQVAMLGGHAGHIGDLDWDATGERLLSCSGDSTVRIWEPVPVRTRVEARDARADAVLRMQPTVDTLLTTLADPQRVRESITNNGSLTPLERKTALQLVLARGVNNAMPLR